MIEQAMELLENINLDLERKMSSSKKESRCCDFVGLLKNCLGKRSKHNYRRSFDDRFYQYEVEESAKYVAAKQQEAKKILLQFQERCENQRTSLIFEEQKNARYKKEQYKIRMALNVLKPQLQQAIHQYKLIQQRKCFEKKYSAYSTSQQVISSTFFSHDIAKMSVRLSATHPYGIKLKRGGVGVYFYYGSDAKLFHKNLYAAQLIDEDSEITIREKQRRDNESQAYYILLPKILFNQIMQDDDAYAELVDDVSGSNKHKL